MAEYTYVNISIELLMKPKNANCGFKKLLERKKLLRRSSLLSFLDMCDVFHAEYFKKLHRNDLKSLCSSE